LPPHSFFAPCHSCHNTLPRPMPPHTFPMLSLLAILSRKLPRSSVAPRGLSSFEAPLLGLRKRSMHELNGTNKPPWGCPIYILLTFHLRFKGGAQNYTAWTGVR
jgi:hypothetical protein